MKNTKKIKSNKKVVTKATAGTIKHVVRSKKVITKAKKTQKPSKNNNSVVKAVRHTNPTQEVKKAVKAAKQPVIDVALEHERMKVAGAIISSERFSDFISKNVGKQALVLVEHLNANQLTDDRLAVKMDVKVNEVRRMLNVLNGYGITKYEINKDGKGWLTFKWYLDRQKLGVFDETVLKKKEDHGPVLQTDCNDFFFCPSCYKDQKVILPFDSAFEMNFRCECGKLLEGMDKEKANTELVKTGSF